VSACERCGAPADADLTDVPTEEPLCQGCLDDISHAEDERRTSARLQGVIP
jgi:hypothetical protein